MTGNVFEQCKPSEIKLLAVIVDRGSTKKLVEILREEHVRLHFICLAEGTAGSDIMALLGLDDSNKSFVICIRQSSAMPSMIRKISERLKLRKAGKGIAFTLSLSGVSASILKILADSVQNAEVASASEEKGEKEVDNTKHPGSKYDLVLSIVGQGHVDDVMDAAKSAGARGGTVLHGRRAEVGEGAGFFGIPIQTERDIVAILAQHENKNEIMKAIATRCGAGTEANGIVLSLPVDEIEGFGEQQDKTPGQNEGENVQNAEIGNRPPAGQGLS